MADFHGTDNDDLQFGGGFVNYYGGNGNDFLAGTNSANQLYGGDGNDVLVGASGDGIGASGDGTAGNPRLWSTFPPGSGNDYLEGGSGRDAIFGADGNDILYGGDGDDSGAVLGYGGFFNIAGLFGGDGNDDLNGGGGADYLDGGGDNDLLVGGGGADMLNGGFGFDFVRYDLAASGVTIRLDWGQGYGDEAAGDTFIGIEGAIGTSFADALVGDEVVNILYGRAGDDAIFGQGGNDVLLGEDGNDHLWGGAGADNLDGSAGFDFARYDFADAGVEVRLYNASLNTSEAAGDMYSGIEGLVGSAFNDTLYGDGTVNVLYGQGGDDWLDGVGAGDSLFGGDGNDNIVSRDGGDKFDGGVGWDNVRYDYATSGVAAVLYNSSLNAGWAAGDTYSGIEGLVGSTFGDDLRGDANVNALYGQGGNDFIVGAGGVDYLNGGAGSDMFFFSAPTDGGGALSGDIIQDFASGVDRFGISGANFGLGSPGGATLESWRFVSSSNANLATTQFGYDSPSGHVWYDVDGTGAAGQIVLATLQPGATLTHSDFIVF